MVNIQLKRDSADPVNYTNLSGSSPSDTSTAATSTFWSQHEYELIAGILAFTVITVVSSYLLV
ncbi:MAG: hypothetical protein TREMPRED_001693 [Tremellales sp. Tagirdzhanova-0007]|nr:MAG: hypothetical protein TREMPRED_001693 [Tremellales sp. Tagirdzhanova-0007]